MKTSRRDFLAAMGTAGVFGTATVDAAINWNGKLRLLQGPMLGSVSPEKALVWGRVGGEHDVQLQVIDESGVARSGPTTRSSAADDFCINLESPPLDPGSR